MGFLFMGRNLRFSCTIHARKSNTMLQWQGTLGALNCAFTSYSYAKATIDTYKYIRSFRKDTYELKTILRKMDYADASFILCISRLLHPLTSNALSEDSALLNLSMLPKDMLSAKHLLASWSF